MVVYRQVACTCIGVREKVWWPCVLSAVWGHKNKMINDVDIGPAGSTYFRYIGTGNAHASRTSCLGPNIP